MSLVQKFPEQEKFLTPDQFVNQEFGKTGGTTTVNEAVRMSRYINKLSRAHVQDNSVIYGFNPTISFTDKDLIVTISKGKLIQDSTVIEIPNISIVTFTNLPAYVSGAGKLVVLTNFKYSDSSNSSRPKIDRTYSITDPTPVDQVLFNPFSFEIKLYDENTSIVADYDPESNKILVASIKYVIQNGIITDSFVTEDRNININGTSTEVQYGGRLNGRMVDGGKIS